MHHTYTMSSYNYARVIKLNKKNLNDADEDCRFHNFGLHLRSCTLSVLAIKTRYSYLLYLYLKLGYLYLYLRVLVLVTSLVLAKGQLLVFVFEPCCLAYIALHTVLFVLVILSK